MQRTPTQGSKLKLSTKNGVNTKHKKNDSVSTPVPNHVDSPPGMADSPSPIPFLCTQDESDVVWNYYSPSSDNGSPTSNTPVTRKRKQVFYYNDFSPVTRMPTKKKFIRPAIKNMEFLKGLKEELTALNQNLINKAKNKKIDKTTPNNASPNSSIFENSSEDIFTSETQCVLPKEGKSTSTPQRSHSITDFEDSMNEILIKATQHIEENVNSNVQSLKSQFSNKFKIESPKIVNDSLDNLLGNMNDSEIEILASQAPVQTSNPVNDYNIIKSNRKVNIEKPQTRNTRNNSKLNVLDNWNEDGDSIFNNLPDLSTLVSSSIQNESKSKFMRHNSMPESPNRVPQTKKSQFSGKTFSRHISMPVSGAKMVCNSEEFSQVIRCTPEDIKRKHEAAKEKLMAKKLEPLAKKSPQAFYGQNKTNTKTPVNVSSNRGQPLRTVSSNNIQSRYNSVSNTTCHNNNNLTNVEVNKKMSIQEQIEKKRQDALLKLQRNRTLGAKK